GAILPSHVSRRILGGEEPAAILGCPKQRGEASCGVETGHAQPIDGAVAANQSRRFAVANHCVVFDSQGHSISSIRVRVSTGVGSVVVRLVVWSIATPGALF